MLSQWKPIFSAACTIAVSLLAIMPAQAASMIPIYDLDTTKIPADYSQFTLDLSDKLIKDITFNKPDSDWEAYGGRWYPLKDGADGSSFTYPDAGIWHTADGDRRISATFTLVSYNGCAVADRADPNLSWGDKHVNSVWLQILGASKYKTKTAGGATDNTSDKQKEIFGPATPDANGMVGCKWKVDFTYADGAEEGQPVPSTFKGMTGFNDLDGTREPDLLTGKDLTNEIFEAVDLSTGVDGVYKMKNAMLKKYGQNGWGGYGEDAGDEMKLDSGREPFHRLTITWTGPSFEFDYETSIGNPWLVLGKPMKLDDLAWKATVIYKTTTGVKLDSKTLTDQLEYGDKWNAGDPPVFKGYKYVGLANGSDPITGVNGSPDGSSKPGDRTITMLYEPIPSRLVYDSNKPMEWQTVNGVTKSYDGLEGDSPSIAENGYSLAPSDSQDTSWAFRGWNTKRDGTGDWYCPSSMKMGECTNGKTVYQDLPALSTGVVTLYAQWAPATTAALTPLHDLPETGSRDLIMILLSSSLAIMIITMTTIATRKTTRRGKH